MSLQKGKDDYLVGILTALPIERAAVRAMLDEEHPTPFNFIRHPLDPNSYTWGAIARHNVVLASLSAGVYGTTSATTTILPMKYAFPQIKWGLMVGIAAGIPSEERDIRLGDVVVSQPKDNSGGVFQYDFGKVKENDDWQSVGWLARPPEILLRALANLQSEHEFHGPHQAQQHLNDAIQRHHDWGTRYGLPQGEIDRLFLASYSHQKASKGCTACDTSKVVERAERDSSNFRIHYGVIASGNFLVKDAQFRDRIARRMDQCICLEMEAAGMMNDFPCLVIRGICDYADSHKNDNWQRYASATAAAFAKELLGFMSTIESSNEKHSVRTEIQSTTDHFVNLRITNHAYNATSATMNNRRDGVHDMNSMSTTSALNAQSRDLVVRSTLLAKVMEELGDLTDIDKKINLSGDTLLIQAAQNGDFNMAKLLIDRGANVHSRNIHDWMPLHKAAAYGHLELARLLLDQKADLQAVAADKCTALHTAVYYGNVEIVALLIDRKVNLEAVDVNKYTALHTAAWCGHVEVVRQLLASGANPMAKSSSSERPSDLAKKKGHREIVEILKDYGAGPRSFFFIR